MPSVNPPPARFLPVRMMIITTAKMSGYLASTPGASMVMYFLQNSSMCCPMISSNVALQALATLEVPGRRKKRTRVTLCSCHTLQKQGTLHSFWPRQLSKAASEGSLAFGARVLAEFPLQTQLIASQGEGPHRVFFSPLEQSKPQPVLKAPALISAKAISHLRLML